MKTVWYVKYEIATESDIKKFDNLEEANIFARKLLKKHSAIPEYINDIRNGNRKSFRGAVADFLEKYYSDPEFVFKLEDIPSDRAEDYSEKIPDGMVFGEDLDDDDDSDYEYYSPTDYFEEDEFMSPLSASEITGGLGIDGTDLPDFQSNISFLPNEYGSYIYYEEKIYIEIYNKQFGSGGRSNPLKVLEWLKNGNPFRITGNSNELKRQYEPDFDSSYTEAERDDYDFMSNRTIFRHIDLLQSLGYIISKEKHIAKEDYPILPGGIIDYFAPQKRFIEYSFTLVGKQKPKKDAVFKKSSYPIIVLHILEEAEKPLLQNEIIERAKEMFNGTTIHRKAIGNSIKELLDFGYKIEHTKEGYFLTKKRG